MRTVDVDSLLAPYPTGYYSQQCQCTRAEMDRIIAQNAQQSINVAFLAPVPKPQYTTTARRGYTGDCKHCGAPANPYKEKCDYCDCYY